MPGNPSLAEDIANQSESSSSSQCYRVWMLQAYLNFKLPAHPCRRWRQIHPFHAHPVGSRNIFCDTSTGSLRPLVPLQLRATAQYFSPWCQSLQEIDLIKICLARDVQRCWFLGQIVSFMPKIQSINSCSFYSFSYSSTNPEIFSRSCGSCWSSPVKSWFYLSIHHDRQNYEMAGGRSLVLHHSWILCSCSNFNLDFKVRSSCSYHVW